MQGHAEDGAPPAAPSAGAAQHPVTRVREQFSVAATALTRLYRSPDRSRFAQAANAVTNLYREAEADAFRANHRGLVYEKNENFPSFFPVLMSCVAALETLWQHVWTGSRGREHMLTVRI
jgi:hypothetical protein